MIRPAMMPPVRISQRFTSQGQTVSGRGSSSLVSAALIAVANDVEQVGKGESGRHAHEGDVGELVPRLVLSEVALQPGLPAQKAATRCALRFLHIDSAIASG